MQCALSVTFVPPLPSPPQDEFYLRYLVKNHLFEPVMTAFKLNGSRYNLLNSAVLELVEFVRRVSERVTGWLRGW